MTIFAIMWELISVSNIKRVHKFNKSFQNKKFDEYTSQQKSFAIYMMGYFTWNLIGFLSFQWVVFLFIFMLGLIPKNYIVVRWLDSAISLVLMVFIVLNAYHFKIDVWSYLVSVFNNI